MNWKASPGASWSLPWRPKIHTHSLTPSTVAGTIEEISIKFMIVLEDEI